MEDAVRALQQQVNEFTVFDNQEDVPDQKRTPWNFPCLTWSQRVPRCGQSWRRLKMCGATQYKPNRPKSTARTFDRGSAFVAACSIWSHAHTCSSLSSCSSSCSSQRVGALSLIPSCLGISGHSSESRQRHPRYVWGPISGKAVGGPNHSSA